MTQFFNLILNQKFEQISQIEETLEGCTIELGKVSTLTLGIGSYGREGVDRPGTYTKRDC